jgi:hypothetical protein
VDKQLLASPEGRTPMELVTLCEVCENFFLAVACILFILFWKQPITVPGFLFSSLTFTSEHFYFGHFHGCYVPLRNNRTEMKLEIGPSSP